jgi:hypothetical protein
VVSAVDFEVPVVFAAISLQELQNRKRHWKWKLLLPLAFEVREGWGRK